MIILYNCFCNTVTQRPWSLRCVFVRGCFSDSFGGDNWFQEWWSTVGRNKEQVSNNNNKNLYTFKTRNFSRSCHTEKIFHFAGNKFGGWVSKKFHRNLIFRISERSKILIFCNLQGKGSYTKGEKGFRGDLVSWFGQKRYFLRKFNSRKNQPRSQDVLPSQQACGKLWRQNALGTRLVEEPLKPLKAFMNLRYAGYKQYTWWIHNRLGKGIRRAVAPSCALWRIRKQFPGSNVIYIPFTESIMWLHKITKIIFKCWTKYRWLTFIFSEKDTKANMVTI